MNKGVMSDSDYRFAMNLMNDMYAEATRVVVATQDITTALLALEEVPEEMPVDRRVSLLAALRKGVASLNDSRNRSLPRLYAALTTGSSSEEIIDLVHKGLEASKLPEDIRTKAEENIRLVMKECTVPVPPPLPSPSSDGKSPSGFSKKLIEDINGGAA